MSLKLTSGTIRGAIRAIIYGTEGIGKSTLAGQIPGSITLDYEDGTKEIDLQRHTVVDWRDGESAVVELLAKPPSAVVVDTADWCERMLLENILKRKGWKSIEDAGYGKGYTMVQEEFSRFLIALDGFIAKGTHVIFVAHSTVKRLSPPDQTDGFDRYELNLTKQVAPLLKEWADVILFCNYKVQIVEGSDGRLKAQGGKERTMFATHSAAWDAKNRFGLPDEMKMEFAQIAHLFGGVAPRVEEKPAAVAPVAAPVAPAPSDDTIDHAVIVPANIEAWLDKHAEAVNTYLVRVTWIKAGQTWRNLSEEKQQSIMAKAEKFARAASIPAL